MVKEILLRIVDPQYRELQSQIAEILVPDFKVSLIDDSVLSSGYEAIFSSYEKIICISSDIDLSKLVGDSKVSRFKISRVFSQSGVHLGWRVPSLSSSLIELDSPLLARGNTKVTARTCIIDTDIATGSTRTMALRLFPGADFFAPVKLAAQQDLLDIEDLVLERSLIWKDNQFFKINYLDNESFFCKRTSIPSDRYNQVLNLVKEALVTS